jgi:FMN phosphatase YigB (HAD superfamily)
MCWRRRAFYSRGRPPDRRRDIARRSFPSGFAFPAAPSKGRWSDTPMISNRFRPPRLFITDLDNTIYNWVDFFGPSYRGMLHALCKRSNVSERSIESALIRMYNEHGSLEYPACAEELDCFRSLPPIEIAYLTKLMFQSFNVVRTARLRIYDGVVDLFTKLHATNIPIVALTNSPLEPAKRRLLSLGIAGCFSGIAGPALNAEKQVRAPLFPQWSPGILRSDRHFSRIIVVPTEQMKPDPGAYQAIVDKWNVSPEQCWVLGDSLLKDLEPASRLGMGTIWARYGGVCESHNMETILRITHWSAADLETAYGQGFQPDHAVDNVKEVIALISSVCS